MRELAELMAGLPNPATTAHRFKRILQSIFEATYAFDLEELHKLNLGPATERMEKIDGTTKFSVAYTVQAGLAGHWIPMDSGALAVLHLVDLATSEDVAVGVVPGLERAIPKNAGVEFGSLLHQLGADFTASPYSQTLHAVLLEIEPAAKDRLPSPPRQARGCGNADRARPGRGRPGALQSHERDGSERLRGGGRPCAGGGSEAQEDRQAMGVQAGRS